MFKNILVPLDGSQLAEAPLPKSQEMARASGGSLHLLHVVSRSPELETARAGGMETAESLEYSRDLTRRLIESRLTSGRDYLERIASQFRGSVADVRTAVLEGSADEQILNYARQHGIDLVIMSTRGHGGIRRLFLGSVTDRLVRANAMPVLVWPTEQRA